jgi:poly(3-hydroxybutyrate) depolymerase
MKTFTQLIRAALLCLPFFAATSNGYSQQIEKSLVLSNKERIGFLEYKPTNYATEGNVKHPLIIFLHGIGERGNGTTDLHNVTRIGLPRMIRMGHNMTFTWNGKTETFLVLSPQCRGNYGMWPELLINEIIDYAKQNLRIDTNRIYLTGLSMGGGGTYRFISRQQWQAAKVAAAATVCAPCTFANGKNVADANLPVWSFHALNDSIALESCTETAIKRIIDAKPAVMPLKTVWPDGGHGVWDRLYTDTNYRYNGVINIYEWFLGQNKSLPVNKLPVANAGQDLRVALSQPVILDGSASRDADGKLVRYVWKKISGPASGKITTVMGAKPTTTVTGITLPGVYQYELAVVDDRAGFTRDTVVVNVAADLPVPNKIPVANAGKDTTIQLPQALSLVGSGTDADGKIVTYTWQKASGGNVKLVKTDDKTVRLDSLEAGDYVFRLLVKDDKGGLASDVMKVKVLPAAPKAPQAPQAPQAPAAANKIPVSHAGRDTTIQLPQVLSLVGNGTDPDGKIVSYMWQKASGGKVKLVKTDDRTVRLDSLEAGDYVFRLLVKDDKGGLASDVMKVKVLDNPYLSKSNGTKPNVAPVARVTPDQVIPIEWNYFPSVSGYPSTDADGWIALFTWEKVSGPDAYNIVSPRECRTRITGLVQGEYVFRVTAYDNHGAYSHADVKITMTKDGQKTTETKVASAAVVEEEVAKTNVTPLTSVTMPAALSLYPNPATSMVNLQYTNDAMGSSVIKIYDASGKLIKSISFWKSENTYKHNLEISKLNRGLYYIEVRTGSAIAMQSKLIKQ